MLWHHWKVLLLFFYPFPHLSVSLLFWYGWSRGPSPSWNTKQIAIAPFAAPLLLCDCLLFIIQLQKGMRKTNPPLCCTNVVSFIVSHFHLTLFISLNICRMFGSLGRRHWSFCFPLRGSRKRGEAGEGEASTGLQWWLSWNCLAGLFTCSGEAIAKHVLKWNLQEGFLSAWQNCRCVDCRGFCVVAFANLSLLEIVQKVYFTSRSSQKGSEYLCVHVCVCLSPAL